MKGIVSLLPEVYTMRVEALWLRLTESHPLAGVRNLPPPHFSWQIGEQADWWTAKAALQPLAQSTRPLTVRTAGLGFFTGAKPVVFIPVVKNAALLHLHEAVCARLKSTGVMDDPLYRPEAWMPHITLAVDVTPDAIHPFINALACEDFAWEMRVDNLTLLNAPEGRPVCTVWRLPLTGE